MAEEKLRTKCRICGSECPAGAKLCRDCAAARKRAFAATVTQPLLAAAGAPSVSQPRFAPRPATPRGGSRAAASDQPRSEAVLAASAIDREQAPRRLSSKGLWAGALLALVLVLLLIRVFASRHDTGEATGSEATESAAPADSPSPAPRAVVSPAAPVAAPVLESALIEEPAKPVKAKSRPRRAPAKIELPPLAPPPPRAETAEPRALAPPVQVPRDRWQPMNEGMARCARLDWAGRATCEREMRLRYCTDFWGQVAQCPLGPSDHGS